MKKLFISLLFSLMLLASSFALKTANNLDGTDWKQWNIQQKSFVIVGYYIANDMFIVYSTRNIPDDTKNEERKQYEDFIFHQFGYDMTIGELIIKIDSYYLIPSNEKEPLWATILLVCGKEFWQTPENTPTPTPAPTPQEEQQSS